MIQLSIMAAIGAERKFQDNKWGKIEDNPHTPAGWMMLIRSELTEAELALIKGGMGRDTWRAELLQVAALCIAALEQHGLTAPLDLTRREL